MAAWMMATDDHSYFEIMLGAETFMPPEFSIAVPQDNLQEAQDDLQQLWPADISTSDGIVFEAKSLWCAAGSKFSSEEGAALVQRMALFGDYARPFLFRSECQAETGSALSLPSIPTADTRILVPAIALALLAAAISAGLVKACTGHQTHSVPDSSLLNRSKDILNVTEIVCLDHASIHSNCRASA